MAFRSLTTALAATSHFARAQNTSISIPGELTTRALTQDVYGYSIEPIWLDTFVNTSKMHTLFSTIADLTGVPPPIRVGGNSADATYIHPSLSTGNDSVALPGLPDASSFNITPAWFRTWADYFPAGTQLIYTLNLAVNDSDWSNAVAQAEAASAGLGDRLVGFELGNEIDHFINKGWRNASWGVEAYLQQVRDITGQITGADWYRNLSSSSSSNNNNNNNNTTTTTSSAAPKFQAGVFADPPWVPDQQDEQDDFSIANLTAAEDPADRAVLMSYATHLYPQSTCDEARWLRMRLDLLSDHATLWRNLSQYAPQVAAADAAGTAPLVMGETNSVSCGGRSGISDTFGAALWGVDYVLGAASLGFAKVYFHLGAQSEYSAFTPQGAGQDYPYKNESLEGGIRPGWYAHYFIARTVAGGAGRLGVAALPGANSSALSGYAVYDHGEEAVAATGTGTGAGPALRKLVFLDMGVWNGTEGLGNPSTLSVTDGTTFSNGTRPSRALSVSTPWCGGAGVAVTRLVAPGTNAKSEVSVSGVGFDPATGDRVGEETVERLMVGEGGLVSFSMKRAEGVLLEVEDATCGDGSGSVPVSSMASYMLPSWLSIAAGAGLAVMMLL
ncbi:hypothetical protein F5Y15DRAFT_426201 [Xylariaceae sp. FL0016]|nr:hypothetical protein F5Y15DRAFT_426201 [Xylariaceae sp. FL0016]